MTFSNPTESFDEIEKELVTNLSNLYSIVQDFEKSGEWTKAVNEIIYQFAKHPSRNYLIAGKNLKFKDCTEWLYDLVLYENNQYGLDNVHLVLECEWDNRFFDCDYEQRIQEDFEKLLVARCKYKVMIYEGKNSERLKGYNNQMLNTVKHCKLTNSNDRYLLCGWNQDALKFEFTILTGN